jgi:fructuronate reductase
VLRVLVAPEAPSAVLEALADPAARIASLTVTEKGYCHDPATTRLRLDHPDIAHDLAHPGAPRSAIGYLVRALAMRRQRGLGGLALMSLDNLPSNGDVLRGAVLDFARRLQPALAGWIEAHCSFPNSMVDRIVPRTTDADRAQVSQALGATDAWPVMGEPFLDWAVEDEFVAGRPDWRAGGARFVPQAAPWEKLKLRMVNGTHSSIAYLGAMAGWQTVDRAIGQPALRRHIEALMREEIEPTLAPLPGLDLPAYRASLVDRFANPALAHRTHQIAMDGSQKLPQRLLGTVRDRLAAGAPIHRLALGIAAWLHYLRGRDEAGQAYALEDPLSAQLSALSDGAAASADPLQRARHLVQLPAVFGDLAGSPALAEALAPHLQSLSARGVAATLEAL